MQGNTAHWTDFADKVRIVFFPKAQWANNIAHHIFYLLTFRVGHLSATLFILFVLRDDRDYFKSWSLYDTNIQRYKRQRYKLDTKWGTRKEIEIDGCKGHSNRKSFDNITEPYRQCVILSSLSLHSSSTNHSPVHRTCSILKCYSDTFDAVHS